MMKTKFKHTLLAGGIALGLFFSAPVSMEAYANVGGNPHWQPSASETLVKMPTSTMQKRIERDYRNSSLAGAIQEKSTSLNQKKQTIGELMQTLDQTQGEMRTEMRHQVLAQKRDYLNIVGERNEMRKRAVETRISLYRNLLDKLNRENQAITPQQELLIARQEAARARAEQKYELVEDALFADGPGKESKYNQEYNKNQGLIEQLLAQVKLHKVNQSIEIDGEAISKQDYLRQLIADQEADLALIDQEEQILGLMSKLVALDAMALSEEIADAQDIEAGGLDEAETNPLHNIADMFVGNF